MADMSDLLPSAPEHFPAETMSFALAGPAGKLECEAKAAAADVARDVVAVICHPLSTDGGSMHNKVVTMVERSLRESGVDTVVFNFRSVGRSEGEFDQGHGESDDLAAVVDETRRVCPEEVPLILFGHSLGGLVAASFVARGVRPVDALVLSSPGLDPGLDAAQKLLLAVLPRIAPNLRVGNGIDSGDISHDRAVVQAYRDDPFGQPLVRTAEQASATKGQQIARIGAGQHFAQALHGHAHDGRSHRQRQRAAVAMKQASVGVQRLSGQAERRCQELPRIERDR
jgi:alpha/beta superfamily hydrolase